MHFGGIVWFSPLRTQELHSQESLTEQVTFEQSPEGRGNSQCHVLRWEVPGVLGGQPAGQCGWRGIGGDLRKKKPDRELCRQL